MGGKCEGSFARWGYCRAGERGWDSFLPREKWFLTMLNGKRMCITGASFTLSGEVCVG